MFDSRLRDATKFRAAYCASSSHVVIDKDSQDAANDRTNKVDNQVSKIVRAAEEHLEYSGSQGTEGVEGHIGDRAEGKNVCSHRQGDDEACPAGRRTAVNGCPHNYQEKEKCPNKLRRCCHDVTCVCVAKIRRTVANRRCIGKTVAYTNKRRPQERTNKLSSPVDCGLVPGNTPGDSK